jgi:hypothetical protein
MINLVFPHFKLISILSPAKYGIAFLAADIFISIIVAEREFGIAVPICIACICDKNITVFSSECRAIVIVIKNCKLFMFFKQAHFLLQLELQEKGTVTIIRNEVSH